MLEHELGEKGHGVFNHRQTVTAVMDFASPTRVLHAIDMPLRVRHEAEYAARFVTDTSNVELSAVRVCGVGNGRGGGRQGTGVRGQAVAEYELAGTVELLQRCFVASYELAFGVGNGEIHPLNAAQEDTFVTGNTQMHPAILELAAVVEGQCGDRLVGPVGE